MKKIMSIIFLCAGFALCDEIVEESSADVVENAATETETVENQTQALAPTEKTELGSRFRAFGEIGAVIFGAGVRYYMNEPRTFYVQGSLQYDAFVASFIRIPVLFYLGGTHWHGIVGLTINIADNYKTGQLVHAAAGINYDINRHVGINIKVLSPLSWPSEVPVSPSIGVQLAY
ncbi:hypothetical protein [uncultured Fibrobacter sp.]|uniref:hypothetical protein n=1 Tax=uncultured Fibrobacter sp. TaxID=261512 RepID=UPI0025EB5006|nr:hypothetical protein [uncultured Fibrobacter sp.]